MNNKKCISFSLIILILIISLSIVSATDNTTQTIQGNTTPSSIEKSFEDIQIAIDNANENDTIELEGTYNSQGKEIKINKSITISSKNIATLNGKEKSTIFNISNVNVCLNNLNIINSKSNFQSAIYSTGNLKITNSKFLNNTVYIPYNNKAPYDDDDTGPASGAIYSTNNLQIINTTFDDNYAIRQLYEWEHEFDFYDVIYGGALYSTGNLSITRTKINNDIVSKSKLYIENSEFTTSTISTSDETTIINSTFSKNYNQLYITSNLTLINCNFTDITNQVIFTDFDEKNFNKIIIDKCNFINNTREKNDEYEAAYDPEFIISFNSHVYINATNFINNDGTLTCLEGILTITNSNFQNNSGKTINCENARIINCTFINNYQALIGTNMTILNCDFKNNKNHYGSAIYGDHIILDNSSFSNNRNGVIHTQKTITVNGTKYSGETTFDNKLNTINLIKINVGKLTTTYNSGKYLKIKLTFIEDGTSVYDYPIKLKIMNGKKTKYKHYYIATNGIVKFKTSNLNVGNYKIEISKDYDSPCSIPKTTTTIKITKAKTIIKAPKMTNKYKKSKYFKITVKNKATKKFVKNTYIKIKINKKTYKIKTNSKGIAKFNTKNLKVGTYKVKITSGNSNYKVQATSQIKIKR